MSSIKLFESKEIRTVWNEEDQKWYFVVEDVVLVLTDRKDPKQYIKRMRQRDKELAKEGVQKGTLIFCKYFEIFSSKYLHI